MAIQMFSLHRKRQRKSSKLNLPHDSWAMRDLVNSCLGNWYPLKVFEDSKKQERSNKGSSSTVQPSGLEPSNYNK